MPMNLIGLPVTARIDKRGAAARIAIDAGQHDAGDADALGEALGDIDRVLAGHGVGDEQALGRLHRVAHRRDLEHQRLVDMEPAGGVEDDHVVASRRATSMRAPGDGDRLLARDDRQGRDLDLAAEHGELLLRRRALHVERGQQHLLALALFEEARELGRGRGLARALQAEHQDRRPAAPR